MRPKAKLKTTKDNTRQLYQALTRIARSKVYVGIPVENNPRDDDSEIGNAALLFIHAHGSPARSIPQRQVIEPAVEANRELITKPLGDGARALLDGDPSKARAALEAAGQLAANASIRWFTDPRNNWAPNAPSTIRRKGSDRPLINEGEMRGAITYFIDEG
jgi:hypothetical protein